MEKTTFENLVDQEVLDASTKFGPLHSAHEAYAIIQEEVDEFWDGVKTKGTSNQYLLDELVQIAAMARRAAEDLHLWS